MAVIGLPRACKLSIHCLLSFFSAGIMLSKSCASNGLAIKELGPAITIAAVRLVVLMNCRRPCNEGSEFSGPQHEEVEQQDSLFSFVMIVVLMNLENGMSR